MMRLNKKPLRAVLCICVLVAVFSSCRNDMVEWILRDDDLPDITPVAYLVNDPDGVFWYESLWAAVEAATNPSFTWYSSLMTTVGLSGAHTLPQAANTAKEPYPIDQTGTVLYPVVIKLRRNANQQRTFGFDPTTETYKKSITIPAGFHIKIEPYTKKTAGFDSRYPGELDEVVVGRWKGNDSDALITIENGASLNIENVFISAGNIADKAAVHVKASGSAVGAHGNFIMTAGAIGNKARIDTLNEVRLDNDNTTVFPSGAYSAKITLDTSAASFSAYPVARITPRRYEATPTFPGTVSYPDPPPPFEDDTNFQNYKNDDGTYTGPTGMAKVLGGTYADISATDPADQRQYTNADRFIVTPEPASNVNNMNIAQGTRNKWTKWESPRYWVVRALSGAADDYGYLSHVVARWDKSIGTDIRPYYYETLADTGGYPSEPSAFELATPAVPGQAVTLYLISNIDMSAGVTFNSTQKVKLTLDTRDATARYTIKRVAGAANGDIFHLQSGELTLVSNPANLFVIDGGAGAGIVDPAMWTASTPALENPISSPAITSNMALVTVMTPALLRIGSGVSLQNNCRTNGNGGGVEVSGRFEMSGGEIKNNRAASAGFGNGMGGGIFFDTYFDTTYSRVISGGIISGNDSAMAGGGIMLNYNSNNGVAVRVTMSGSASITGNRARGIPIAMGYSNASMGYDGTTNFGGYGGGVFLSPGKGNEFRFIGGTISGNKSGLGVSTNGRGIAFETLWTDPSIFVMGDSAWVTGGDDILLHNNTVYNAGDPNYDMNYITVVSKLTHKPAAAIVLDVYNPWVPMTVIKLAGGVPTSYYGNFTAVGAHTLATSGANAGKMTN